MLIPAHFSRVSAESVTACIAVIYGTFTHLHCLSIAMKFRNILICQESQAGQLESQAGQLESQAGQLESQAGQLDYTSNFCKQTLPLFIFWLPSKFPVQHSVSSEMPMYPVSIININGLIL